MKIFENPGKKNTAETMKLAFDYASQHGIKNILFATTTGWTAHQLPENHRDFNVVCVGESWGCNDPGMNPMGDSVMEEIRSMGVKLIFAPHAFTAAGTRNGLVSPPAIIADSLRMFSQGTKVCVEISAMALDCGAIPYGEECVAMGGTSMGVDTAMVLTPAHCNAILDTKIHTMLCKPLVK